MHLNITPSYSSRYTGPVRKSFFLYHSNPLMYTVQCRLCTSLLTTVVSCQVCGWWIWEEKFVTTTENVCGNQRVLLFCPMFWVAGYCGSGCFWLFITRLYSSDLRLGWQNRILMTARAQCHRRIALDSHSLQSSNTRSPPSLSVLLIRWATQKTIGNNSLVKLTFRFYFPLPSCSLFLLPFLSSIRQYHSWHDPRNMNEQLRD